MVPEPPAKDQYLVCRSCRNRFLYSAEEQRRSRERTSVPDTCPACRALERLGRRHAGQLDWYNRQRGYGFIKQSDGTSLFVHASDLAEAGRPRPAPGLRVSYRIQQTERGPRAVEIALLPDPE